MILSTMMKNVASPKKCLIENQIAKATYPIKFMTEINILFKTGFEIVIKKSVGCRILVKWPVTLLWNRILVNTDNLHKSSVPPLNSILTAILNLLLCNVVNILKPESRTQQCFPVKYKTTRNLFNTSQYSHHLNVTDCCILCLILIFNSQCVLICVFGDQH